MTTKSPGKSVHYQFKHYYFVQPLFLIRVLKTHPAFYYLKILTVPTFQRASLPYLLSPPKAFFSNEKTLTQTKPFRSNKVMYAFKHIKQILFWWFCCYDNTAENVKVKASAGRNVVMVTTCTYISFYGDIQSSQENWLLW